MKKIILVILMLTSASSSLVNSFNTLNDASKYSLLTLENVAISNDNIDDPIYKNINSENYEQLRSIWSADNFKNLLLSVMEKYRFNGYVGDYIFKITPMPHAQFIIFGPLHGAFHSLVRALKFLEKKGYIDNYFKIRYPLVYIIFLGDIADKSPYILETLALVLNLMRANPNLVFYLKGKCETYSFWENDGLKRQLIEKVQNESGKIGNTIPLETLVEGLFNVLPLAFYVQAINPDEGLINIAYNNLVPQKEVSCGLVLNSLKLHEIESCKIDLFDQMEVPHVRAYLNPENRFKSYKNFNGLTSLEQILGASKWRLFSSPILIYQNFFNFYFDAFTVLTILPKFSESFISLYNRDVRQPIDFVNTETFNLLTTKKLENINPLDRAGKIASPVSSEDIKFLNEKLKATLKKMEEVTQKLFEFRGELKKIISNSKALSVSI